MASGLPELLVQPNGFLDVIHDLLMPETDWSGPKSATSTGSPSRPPELLLDPCRHRRRRRTPPRRCTSSPHRRRLRLPPRPRLPRALQPLVRPPPSPLPRSRRMPRAASSVVLASRACLWLPQPPCLARPPTPRCRSPAHARPWLRSPPSRRPIPAGARVPLVVGARGRLWRVVWAGYARTPGLRPVSLAPTPARPAARYR